MANSGAGRGERRVVVSEGRQTDLYSVRSVCFSPAAVGLLAEARLAQLLSNC